MLQNIFAISLSMSLVILILLAVSPFINKRYSAKWRYFVWLIVALRLIIPIKLELPKTPVTIPAPSQAVVFGQVGAPVILMDEGHAQKGETKPASSVPNITLDELMVIVWAAGAVSFFLYHIINYIGFIRKIKPHCSEAQMGVFGTVLREMKIGTMPRLLKCGMIKSPMMTGFFKPIILLPDNDYSSNELSVILKHELTHYKRGDIWYKLLLIAANSIHWFNPLVYLMARAANRDLEYSCDDIVVKGSDISFRKEYSLAILKAMQSGEAAALSTYLNGGASNE